MLPPFSFLLMRVFLRVVACALPLSRVLLRVWKRNEKKTKRNERVSLQKTREGDPWKRNEKGQIFSLKRKPVPWVSFLLMRVLLRVSDFNKPRDTRRDTLKICRILLLSLRSKSEIWKELVFVCFPFLLRVKSSCYF